MAPRVAGNKVLIGVAGGDHPTRGFFDAYDAGTGARVWRFYTVPGDPSQPYENDTLRKAAKTWSPDFYKMGGGGAVWDGMAYDAEAGLVYVGTGNAEPWVEKFRGFPADTAPGAKGLDNLYTCSILAVDLATGQLKWHYQTTPEDNWDYDSVQQLLLTELTIGGRQRKVVMQASKNGFFYVLDRITGEFISAAPFTQVNWARGFDKAGRPQINPEAFYGKDPVTIFPTAGGAHNWSPMSFNPGTGLVYVPTTYGSWTYRAGDVVIAAQTGHTGLAPGFAPGAPNSMPFIGPDPPQGNVRGVLEAWDPVNQKLVWRTPGGGGIGGGTVSTAGNLVFQSINDGRLLAYSADKGEPLLEIQTGRGGAGPPITYSVSGKQYVALMAGHGTPGNHLWDRTTRRWIILRYCWCLRSMAKLLCRSRFRRQRRQGLRRRLPRRNEARTSGRRRLPYTIRKAYESQTHYCRSVRVSGFGGYLSGYAGEFVARAEDFSQIGTRHQGRGSREARWSFAARRFDFFALARSRRNAAVLA